MGNRSGSHVSIPYMVFHAATITRRIDARQQPCPEYPLSRAKGQCQAEDLPTGPQKFFPPPCYDLQGSNTTHKLPPRHRVLPIPLSATGPSHLSSSDPESYLKSLELSAPHRIAGCLPIL
ncbi:uncharacterized protein UV8b_07964 [Ustilaginoidea virens]|uniref:Uncharacterized protein n=1 Tax=Ustilaginoidea virens TaxID=1159556 RepID=A0A8E5HYN4_USTVR|nr:uncharacterized protein UV8b_07964 [Ustilaginoidea virens]QUC23723.1 hypothetical protein UV8b_07964 [Ustilaginoidea virens]